MYFRHGAQAVYVVACVVLASGWLLTTLAQLAVRLARVRPVRDQYLRVAAVELGEVDTLS